MLWEEEMRQMELFAEHIIPAFRATRTRLPAPSLISVPRVRNSPSISRHRRSAGVGSAKIRARVHRCRLFTWT